MASHCSTQTGRLPNPSLLCGQLFSKFRVYESRFERFNYAVTEQKKIFGTDGVRGVANVEPVTAETALKLGRAAAYVFAQLNPRRTPDGARPKIVLGKDTRLSGYMLENALVAGNHFARSRCPCDRAVADAGRCLHHTIATCGCRHRSLCVA